MRRALALAAALAAGLLPAPARADEAPGGSFALPGLSWEEARGRLLVQLRAADDPCAEGAVFQQDVPHTRTVLMLDAEPSGPVESAGAARDVTVAEAAAWGRPLEDLFRVAIENLERRLPPAVRTTPELPRGVKVNLLYGEHPFAAAYVLSLASHPRCNGRRGTLFAVPNRHALLCYPIESSRAFHAYLALVNLAVDIHASGEAPIVPHVYWLHEGRFDTQLVTIEGNRFHAARTAAFEAMLKDLPRDIHDPGPRRW